MQNPYSFVLVPSDKSFSFSKAESQLLNKWGFSEKNMKFYKLRFNQAFKLIHCDQFMTSLFNSEIIKQIFSYSDTVETPTYSRLNCVETNMGFFKVLEQKDLMVTPGDYLKKEMDEIIEGITCADRFRHALLVEESEHYDCFSKQTTDEFLFHIFKRIALGGPMCQYEDLATDYLNITKHLYKDLVSVGKDQDSGEIKVQSYAFQVKGIPNGPKLWKQDEHPQNWLYLTIDPYFRHLNIWYHEWVDYW